MISRSSISNFTSWILVINSWIFWQFPCWISCSLPNMFHLEAKFWNAYRVFRWLQSSLGVHSPEVLTERYSAHTLSVYIFLILTTVLRAIVLQFTDLLFPSKNLFYSIFTIIFFCLKKRRWNCRSFYMSLKSGFLQMKSHIPCLLFIVIRLLKFLESILISTTVTSSRHNKNRRKSESSLKKKVNWRPEIKDHRSKFE